MEEGTAVDAVTPWLLRVAIDHTGRFEPTQLWDVGIRGAVLADLWLSGRVSEGDLSPEVDTTPAGVWYLDTAMYELTSGETTQLDWIYRGGLSANDIADGLVAAGEWTRHRSLTAPQWRKYRSHAVQRFVPERTRLAHVYDGDGLPATAVEATVAVLGHALNVVRPNRYGSPKLRGLGPSACGAAAAVVEATVFEIFGLAGSSHANSNPAW
jgi:hypothetical protein